PLPRRSTLFPYTTLFRSATWVLYTEFRFGWGPREVGLSLFVVGVVAAVVQGGLLGLMLRVLGEKRAVLFGLASGTLAFAGYGLRSEEHTSELQSLRHLVC